MKTETTKQKKVARAVQVTLSEILQQEFIELNHILVSIPIVRITSDLKIARVYISVFPDNKIDEIMVFLDLNHTKIKGYLGQRMRNQMRAIPEIIFYTDDSENELKRIENLMQKLEENNKEMEKIQHEANKSLEENS